MSAIDKFDELAAKHLGIAATFVDSMSTEIRASAQKAVRDGVVDPLIWLLDCRDQLGLRLAIEWTGDDFADGRPEAEIPYCVVQPVSYQKAKSGFSKSTIDLSIPLPRVEQIDVLAVTEGRIVVIGLPRDPTSRFVQAGPGEILAILGEHLSHPSQDILLQTIVEPIEKCKEGDLVRAIAIPWLSIAREIDLDPEFLFRFAKNPRKFEEFIAATYERAGWPHVVLTSRSGDGGRDVIATMPGLGSVRFLDQCKAFSPGKLVTHDDVRAMFGVLNLFPNSSKAIVTTTSDFQPGILTSAEFQAVMPHRLELRNGDSLRQWLREIVAST